MHFAVFIVTIFSLAFTGIGGAHKKNYPQDYFRSPVNSVIRLSGTFGELRSNHFHSGIDIKSPNGKTGHALLAVADGYVSRIKVQPGGYGKVLYITHPNGYTSVYAHIDKFTDDIEKYIKKTQYQEKRFRVEAYPKANQFSFNRGEKVGTLGMSGHTFGPHLHFEIRNTKTQKPINPLLFGIRVEDNRPPKLHELKIYVLNDKRETLSTDQYPVIRKGADFGILEDTLIIEGWRAGFGLKVYDHMNGVTNWNGIYALSVFKDDALIYQFDAETFSFAETRYINAHLDYADHVTDKSYVNRCYSLPGNRLSIYNKKENFGIVSLHKDKAANITMVAEDVEGNISRLQFWVKRSAYIPDPKPVIYNYYLPYNEDNSIHNSSMALRMSKGVLYENLYLNYQSSSHASEKIYSSVHQIQHSTTPAHKYFDLSIRPTTLPSSFRNKAFIAYHDPKKDEYINCGGEWKDGLLKTKVRNFGEFCIMADEKAPKIEVVNFRTNMKGHNKMSFKITDNVPTAGNVKGLKYVATVDGKWILMEYDSKNDMITHYFDDRISAGSHQLRLEVTDNKGNKSVFDKPFNR